MPRICKMWGFEENWPKTVWTSHGWSWGGHGDSTTDFGTWYSTSPTAGFVTGSKSATLRHSDGWGHNGNDDNNPFHENTGGAGAYASGRIAATWMIDNLGGAGLSATLMHLYPAGSRIDGGGAPWTGWATAYIRADASGSTHILTLYVGTTAVAVLPTTIGRQVGVRIGIDYFSKDNWSYARATANGVGVTDWYGINQVAYSPPAWGLLFGGGGLNATNSTGGLTGKAYITCIDDIVFISDTITDVNTTTQVVTRAEAEPPCPSANYFVRALDVAALTGAVGTWTGAAGDIDIDSSDDTATKVETTDTSTGKPLHEEISFDALSGTAPGSILGQTVRCLASSDTFVTSISISNDSFSSNVTQVDTLGTSATLTEISSTVKASGGALDVTAIDATRFRLNVTA